MASSRPLSDAQRQWLTDLYRSDFPRVLKLCRRMLRNPDDAADAAHEVFLRAIDSSPPRSAGEDLSPWLLTVARNHCLDVLRRQKRLGRVMVTLSADRDVGIDPEGPVVNRQVVAAIFRELRHRERQALWQSAVERRSLAAIAADLRLSYMAAGQLLHRARRHAAVMARRLAAILGLLQLGRLLRRAGRTGARLLSAVRQPAAGALPQHVQQLLAVAIVPLVLASVPSASSVAGGPPRPPVITSPLERPSIDPSGVLRQGNTPPGVPQTLRAAVPAVPTGVPTSLPEVPLPGTNSSLGSVVTTVQRAAGQLPQQTGTITDTIGSVPQPVKPPRAI